MTNIKIKRLPLPRKPLIGKGIGIMLTIPAVFLLCAINLAAMWIGMPAKMDFMDHVSSTVLTTFILSMVIKNYGIVFMGVGLFTESYK